MYFTSASLATVLLATVSILTPTAAAPISSPVAFSGKLYSPADGITVSLGGNFSFSYDTTQPYQPHLVEALSTLDVGIQGPTPIDYSSDFSPFGILEVLTGLKDDGPGNWINETVTLPEEIYKAGTYFLIVTEHQLPTRDPDGLTYRAQTFNTTINVV